MTAQNTKTIQYRLRNGQSVEVTINNDGVPGEKVSISDLAIEKTIMCHLGFTEEVSKKHGVAIWIAMDTGMRKFITARTPGMTMMDLMQIAPLFECEPLDVFSNPAICQQLYGEMKLAVIPSADFNRFIFDAVIVVGNIFGKEVCPLQSINFDRELPSLREQHFVHDD